MGGGKAKFLSISGLPHLEFLNACCSLSQIFGVQYWCQYGSIEGAARKKSLGGGGLFYA